jgi:N-acetylglucosaminyldiphosphoundecaprenol N-acetyl-beta-D-mannosaminyltransferase
MAMNGALASRRIVNIRVDATSYEDASRRVTDWAMSGQPRFVAIASVNNVIQASDDGNFARTMHAADLVTPDGMPLVWGLRLLGIRSASRVYGPDLMPIVCERAAALGIPVGFYGGTPEVLEKLVVELTRRFPALLINYSWAPPFRPLSDGEEADAIAQINDSGARILFVGIGTPKQEFWMERNRPRLKCAMLGVGAAFDFIAGVKRQAPRGLRRLGLEWIYRLVHEPRRLWKRYLYGNPKFVVMFVAQLIRDRKAKGADRNDDPSGTSQESREVSVE